LSAEAKAEWRRVAPQLHEIGLLIGLDRALLAAYCAAFARWRLAERTLAEMAEREPLAGALTIKTVSGNAIQNPVLGVANKAARDMASFAAELGLTPVSRIRLQLKPPLPDDDPAARYLR
jgi:P27 family predicted phage terminase small subunit